MYQDNYASVYGNDTASYAVRLEFKTYEELPDAYRNLQTVGSFSSFEGV